MMLSGWGRFPRQSCAVSDPRDIDELAQVLQAGSAIARGNGRSYGDSALNPVNTIDMRRFGRMISFDPMTGQIVAEAGVLLADIIDTFLPRGWFPSVTPGTRFVTVGGMIASDVHGKNHHLHGAFGAFLDWIEVMAPDGRITRCSRTEKPELFHWTVGGMGLTGPIVCAAFRLRRVETGWIRQTNLPTRNLEETLAAFETHHSSTYSVAWIDCLTGGDALGRSLISLGEHAATSDLAWDKRKQPFDTPAKRLLSMPVSAPAFVLNRHTVRAFNDIYYRRGAARPVEELSDWKSFFYPLDSILNWNRLYGRRGFIQFQCVLPPAASAAGLAALLERITHSGLGSFLAVLKRLGDAGTGISFPMPGYTLALDFPVSPGALDLLTELDRIALDHEGRFYLAKDSRMTPSTLRRSDKRAEDFRAMRQAMGLSSAFTSSQSERLLL